MSTWEIRIRELRGQSIGSRIWEVPENSAEGEIVLIRYKKLKRMWGLGSHHTHLNCQRFLQLLHVEKIDSEVANSKYHSLFFTL